MMRVLKKWFGAEDEPSRTIPDRDPGAAPDYAVDGSAGDRGEDTPYNWRSLDLSSSSVFDSPDTHRVRVLKSAPRRPANDDDNPGYDPYDTGSFSAGKDSKDS